MTLPATLLEQNAVLPWAERFYASAGVPVTKEAAAAAARQRAEALFYTDPDERLAYMESPEWNFSDDHLRQVNRVMDEFLDVTARRVGARRQRGVHQQDPQLGRRREHQVGRRQGNPRRDRLRNGP